MITVSLVLFYTINTLFIYRCKVIAVNSNSPIEQDTFQAVEKVNNLAWKYHVYDPSEFFMYTRCFYRTRKIPRHMSSPKHAVDILFTMKMLSMNDTSSRPEDADIFIIPVFYTQSISGLCGNHSENFDQMMDVLNSKGFMSSSPNHLLITVTHLCSRPHTSYSISIHMHHIE